ncbi:MAG: hypothetical protein QOK13_1076, partial [Gaiellaceae bacterium]|nr:hypothetical protein [Gaiellaceae bacterium]
SAITSPSRTSKSTSDSACTDPKAFERPRSSSVGVVVATSVSVNQKETGGAVDPPLPV